MGTSLIVFRRMLYLSVLRACSWNKRFDQFFYWSISNFFQHLRGSSS